MKKIYAATIFSVLLLSMSGAINQAYAGPPPTPVELELQLVIDISGSVDASEYNLQMDGWANAFRDQGLIDRIVNSNDGICVQTIFFASGASVAIDWRVLQTQAQILAFAQELDDILRPFSGGTVISAGINLAVAQSAINTVCDGPKMIVDVSGDGTSNISATQAARDTAVGLGFTINGLAIENSPSSTIITDFYTNNVIGGPNAFVATVSGFGTFQQAALDKILIEIMEIMSNEVSGEFSPIDKTALLIAGVQSSMLSIVSVLSLLGAIGIGAFYYNKRKN